MIKIDVINAKIDVLLNYFITEKRSKIMHGRDKLECDELEKKFDRLVREYKKVKPSS